MIESPTNNPAGSDPAEAHDLIVCALDLVARRGLHSLSFRELATASAVPFTTISSRYSGKAALVSAVFDEARRQDGAYRATVAALPVVNAQQARDVVLEMTADALGPQWVIERAYLALLLEAPRDEAASALLKEWHADRAAWFAGLLEPLHCDENTGRLWLAGWCGLLSVALSCPRDLSLRLLCRDTARGMLDALTGMPRDGRWLEPLRADATVAEPAPNSQSHETRISLLNAALAVVAEAGAGGLTHRAVAAHAGALPSAANYHLGNKSQMLRATLDHALSQLARSAGRPATPSVQASDGAALDQLDAVHAYLLKPEVSLCLRAVEALLFAAPSDEIVSQRFAAALLRAGRGSHSNAFDRFCLSRWRAGCLITSRALHASDGAGDHQFLADARRITRLFL